MGASTGVWRHGAAALGERAKRDPRRCAPGVAGADDPPRATITTDVQGASAIVADDAVAAALLFFGDEYLQLDDVRSKALQCLVS